MSAVEIPHTARHDLLKISSVMGYHHLPLVYKHAKGAVDTLHQALAQVIKDSIEARNGMFLTTHEVVLTLTQR